MEVCLRPVLLVFAIALLLANLILIAFSTWGQDAVVPVSKATATGLRMQTNGSDGFLDNATTLKNGTNVTTGLTGSVEPQWQSPALLHSVESHDCNFTATTITTTAKNELISEDDFLYCNSHNMFLDRADGYAFTKSQGPDKLFEKWIPYTITPFTFQKFHDTTCSNITDLTQAMRYGTRLWIKPEVQNKTALEREVEQSYFMPFRKNLTLQNVDAYFLPYMNHPVIKNCSKAGKLKVVWMNYHAQSRQLDAKYPAQSRESTAAANQEMEQLLVERGYGHVPILDMMNLTTDAQTSDGYHFLSDVNLYKAYSVLAAADLLAA